MQIPLQITFRETSDPTGAIEAKIREHIEKLDDRFNNIIGCKVVVESPHHAHHQGNLYQVRINLSIPGHTFVVTSESKRDHAHEDVYVAVRDVFESLTRQLQEYRKEEHGEMKVHVEHPRGTISALFPERDSGRILSDDGHDIYFHRNSLTNADLDTLSEGALVEFEMEMGDDGLQATFVKVV
jgi:cold shock CspA family protein/ribosome-associated translation inhibitor RaiA